LPRVFNGPFTSALIVEGPHASLDDHLRQIGITPHRLSEVPDEASLADAINRTQAQILFKRSRVPVTRSLLSRCPSLLGVQLCCIGDDSVDKVACADNGVLVFNDPVSNGRSVVELAFAHLIALARRLYETDVQMRANDWQKTSAGRYEITGKRLGIVGLGNIGRQVARVADGFGVEVSFYDNRPVAVEVGTEMGWTPATNLASLFKSCDMITVHTSSRDFVGTDNDGLLDDVLSLLGADRDPNSPRLFLNLARGNVHSAEALLAAVASGAVRRAAVDVYPSEPRPGVSGWMNPYANEARIMCTPHIGAATQEAQPRIARRVAATVANWSHWGAIRDCVYAPRVSLRMREGVRGHTLLTVVHSTSRGTKKAVDDAIYEAEADNLGSHHRDFEIGVAVDVSLLDRPLSDGEIVALISRAKALAKDDHAIRAVRQIAVPKGGW